MIKKRSKTPSHCTQNSTSDYTSIKLLLCVKVPKAENRLEQFYYLYLYTVVLTTARRITLCTFYRSYLKGLRANIEQQVYSYVVMIVRAIYNKNFHLRSDISFEYSIQFAMRSRSSAP
jgi:hypothetical protein